MTYETPCCVNSKTKLCSSDLILHDRKKKRALHLHDKSSSNLY